MKASADKIATVRDVLGLTSQALSTTAGVFEEFINGCKESQRQDPADLAIINVILSSELCRRDTRASSDYPKFPSSINFG